MAWELPIFDLGTIAAGADLRLRQYRWVVLDATGRWVLAGAGARALGILQNTPNTGEVALVRIAGESKLVVGAGQTAANGDSVGSDASAEARIGGLAAGNHRLARVPAGQGAGAGAIAGVLLGYEGLV